MEIGDKIRPPESAKEKPKNSLAAECGIDEANIRKYESGRQRPKLATLKKIAYALDVDWKILLDTDSFFYQVDKAVQSTNELRRK